MKPLLHSEQSKHHMYGQSRYPIISPRRTERDTLWGYGKITVGDVVRRSNRTASRPGVLSTEEVGTVIRVDGPGHIAPFKVRSARGVEGWYAADELVKIANSAPADTEVIRCSLHVSRGESVGLLCKEAAPGIVYIKGTVQGSPAARAGIPSGMIIRSIAHIPINSAGDVKYAVDMFRSLNTPVLELLLANAPPRSTPGSPRGGSGSPSPRRNVERYYSPPGYATSPLQKPQPSPARSDSGYGSSPPVGNREPSLPGSKSPSVAGSVPGVGNPSITGSIHPSPVSPAASVTSKPPPSAAGSRPPSVAGSNSPSVAGSKSPSVAGSRPQSVAGSVAPAGSAPPSKPASVAGSVTSKSAAADPIDKIQQASLDAHNQKRASHGAPPLQFDAKLAANALKQAEACNASNTLSHGNCDGEGQNAASFGGYKVEQEELVKQAVSDWYDEITDYKKSGGGVAALSGAGHFTQVVWKETTHVGVAVVVSGDSAYVIANYSPPGNMAVENSVRDNVNA